MNSFFGVAELFPPPRITRKKIPPQKYQLKKFPQAKFPLIRTICIARGEHVHIDVCCPLLCPQLCIFLILCVIFENVFCVVILDVLLVLYVF